jgi:hypothetical protein
LRGIVPRKTRLASRLADSARGLRVDELAFARTPQAKPAARTPVLFDVDSRGIDNEFLPPIGLALIFAVRLSIPALRFRFPGIDKRTAEISAFAVARAALSFDSAGIEKAQHWPHTRAEGARAERSAFL